MSKKKYLVIGSSGHQFVDCIEWDVDPLPNIIDYDIIIANTRSITDELLKKISSKNQIETFRKLLTRFLISNGQLIILSDFRRNVKRPNKYPDYLNNYSWCPIDIGTQIESGTTIEIIENKFPNYFSKFNKWEYYLFMPKSCLSNEFTRLIGNTHDTKYKFPEYIFIKNRYGKMLSGSLACEVYYKKTEHPLYGSSIDYFDTTPDRMLGEIVLLPLLPDINDKSAVSILLEDLLGKPQVPLPLDWVKKVDMPLIKEIDRRVENLLEKIRNIDTKIKRITEKKEQIESYKKLLYSDGSDLEDIFKKCLIELGGKVEPAKYSNEEYCFIYKGLECPVEAKGVSKSISLSHLRQLIDYMLKYEEESGNKCKGLLLGNSWKNTPIEERNTKEKPNFPDNVIERAKDMNIALIDSIDFFHAYCKFIEDKKIGNLILDKIIESSGLVNLKHIKK